MSFQDDPSLIRWRLHLKSPPAVAYEWVATDQGRARFWAESAVEADGEIHFIFPNGLEWRGQILERDPPRRFRVRYLGDSVTTFEFADDGAGGTDLTLTDVGVPEADRMEVIAGWVSVLLVLKTAVDHGVDLRNHDPQRTWDQGYAEN
jgi:uncharacterized protein YndB with AHSA1/START domain